MFASADQIAIAIVMSAEQFSENPIKIADGTARSSRGRWHAFAALIVAFPDIDRERLARCCGFVRTAKEAKLSFKHLRATVMRMKWYDPELVRMIATVLVPQTTAIGIPTTPSRRQDETRPVSSPPSGRAAPPAEPGSKRAMAEMLAEAARNTVKMQEKAR